MEKPGKVPTLARILEEVSYSPEQMWEGRNAPAATTYLPAVSRMEKVRGRLGCLPKKLVIQVTASGRLLAQGCSSMFKRETALLDLKQASQLLGVSEATVLQLALEGKSKISTISPASQNRILFLRDHLLHFEEQNSEP